MPRKRSQPTMEGVTKNVKGSLLPPASQLKNPSDDDCTVDFTWSVRRFSTLQGKLLSNTFGFGGHEWNIALFPKGTKGTGESLSVFLNVPCHEKLPKGWARKQDFKLTVIDQLDPSKSVVRDATHTFCAKESDWGFSVFLPLKQLRDPANGFLKGDTLKVRAELRIYSVEDQIVSKKAEVDAWLKKEESTGAFTWSIPRFSTLKGKHYSDTFVRGPHTWNILLYPNGPKGSGKELSVFLNVPDHELLPMGWAQKQSFNLTVIDQLNPSKSVSRASSHTFCAEAIDWGFKVFMSGEQLRDPAKGFLVDDTLKVMCKFTGGENAEHAPARVQDEVEEKDQKPSEEQLGHLINHPEIATGQECTDQVASEQDAASNDCADQVPSDQRPTGQDCSVQDPSDQDVTDQDCQKQDPSDQVSADDSDQHPSDQHSTDPDCLVQAREPSDQSELTDEGWLIHTPPDQDIALESWSTGSWSDESWSLESWSAEVGHSE